MSLHLRKWWWPHHFRSSVRLAVLMAIASALMITFMLVSNQEATTKLLSMAGTTTRHFKGRSVVVQLADTASAQAHHEQGTNGTSMPGYLPLLPWEVERMETRQCQPPYELPSTTATAITANAVRMPISRFDYCCVGSHSARGAVRYAPHVCNLPADIYRRHEQTALGAWSRIPISSTTKTTRTTDSCDVCRIMKVLLDHNWTMAFMGDSVTGQSFAGLECELRRHGYLVHRQPIDYRQVDPNNWTFIPFGLNEVHELHVQKRPLDTDRHAASCSERDATLRYYRVYRPSANLTEMDEIRAKNDVLIFDHGLHYSMANVTALSRIGRGLALERTLRCRY